MKPVSISLVDDDDIEQLKASSIVVYLDTPVGDAEEKLNNEDNNNCAMSASKRCENIYDVRVIVGKHESGDFGTITREVIEALCTSQNYVSTRDNSSSEANIARKHSQNLSFLEAVQRGLADDRGLFVPVSLCEGSARSPLSVSQLQRLAQLTFPERALRFLEHFPVHDGLSLSPRTLRDMVATAYSSFSDDRVLPTTPLDADKQQFLVEEFWGPTASFKDLSLQLTPHLLAHAERETVRSHIVAMSVARAETPRPPLPPSPSPQNISTITVIILTPRSHARYARSPPG